MWEQYSHIKPFGHQDRILAHIFARLVNLTKAEHADSIDIHDILPYIREAEEVMQSAEERMIGQMNRK